ncbi:hypothetical protein [Rhizobium laguerreae]|uniref:Uncharacterized protein n=1 Tax=Rhizobium laguerreae TaxID=1076926 RepID=A0A7Y2RC27_9HYPH|nr:hypothetical protein [Rhizobium laguerreae]NDK54226.1 hypothetical protein [Rhizobium laguerreae]NNH68229.1 hypothetical protein [Rhizobium laguerreae]
MTDNDPPRIFHAQPSPEGAAWLISAWLMAELTEMPNKAITKLADLPPITNDGDNIRPSAPPHADAAAGAQTSAASFEASALAYKPEKGGPIGQSLDGPTDRCTAN